jgi:hypothetical protein
MTVGIMRKSLPFWQPRSPDRGCQSSFTLGFLAAGPITRVLGAKAMGIDLLTDAELLKSAKADFDKRTEGLTYKSPIPDEVKEPAGLPDAMRKFGTRAQLKGTFLKSGGDHAWDSHDHDH